LPRDSQQRELSACPRERLDRPRSGWSSLLSAAEGRILAAGLLLALLSVGAVLMTWLWWPESVQSLLAMTATNVVFGRAAGLSVGYAAGLGQALVTLANMVVETVLVLLVYPLFVLSWRHLLDVRPLRRLVTRTTDAAEAHRDTIQRFGVPGLLVFVFFPFWLTGPVVGCAIGFLLGIRPWLNLTVVLGGTYLAIVCWSLFLGELHARVAVYGPLSSLLLVIIVILLVIGGHFLQRLRSRHPSRGE
jgi:uncharacterized membrane protein